MLVIEKVKCCKGSDCYLAEQRHILLKEGNVEEHSEVVEEGEL